MQQDVSEGVQIDACTEPCGEYQLCQEHSPPTRIPIFPGIIPEWFICEFCIRNWHSVSIRAFSVDCTFSCTCHGVLHEIDRRFWKLNCQKGPDTGERDNVTSLTGVTLS